MQPLQQFQERTEAEIREVLERMRAAWNRGDLTSFMEGYERSSVLRYYSGDMIVKGWDALLAYYQNQYQVQQEKMGKMEFLDVEFLTDPQSQHRVLVRGRWKITINFHEENTGLFTALFRRRAEGWKIVHDHSS